ncbi:MAG: DUF3368 domain-containing protein [Planctomycetes bacterium]|nr:DUF3368 domain-containing protein [Planctomycetota bacterium]
MRRIVSNTGPILHLAEIKALDLLRQAGEVHIPRAVDLELDRNTSEWPAGRPTWLTIHPPQVASPEVGAWLRADVLHIGEAEALSLALWMKADWFLTDDAAARLLARTLGLEIHGSLGVVLWAAATGVVHLDQAQDLLDRLARSSLWMSPRVLREARAALASLFL